MAEASGGTPPHNGSICRRGYAAATRLLRDERAGRWRERSRGLFAWRRRLLRSGQRRRHRPCDRDRFGNDARAGDEKRGKARGASARELRIGISGRFRMMVVLMARWL